LLIAVKLVSFANLEFRNHMMFAGTIQYLSRLSGSVVSVWFVAWAIRRRGEFDIKLTKLEQLLRWLVVAVCFALTLLPSSQLAIPRVIAGLTGICFVAWPNLAHHLSVLFRLIPANNADSE
jgi:uncharacterized membrane protein YcfT